MILVAGPEEAGDTSACWTAGMIADLVRLRFKVDFAPRYVWYLLDRLGFSDQMGTFTADHLNDEAALLWLEERLWKKVKKEAKHMRYFPTFAALVTKVTETLTTLAGMPHERKARAGEYRALTPPAA